VMDFNANQVPGGLGRLLIPTDKESGRPSRAGLGPAAALPAAILESWRAISQQALLLSVEPSAS
jgi:hypothetical protein